MSTPYDDIINHPHHVSRNHPQMSMHDRAAQFSAFAALSGYEEAIAETARQTEQHIELDEQELAELNRRFVFLASRLDEHPMVTIRYFVPDKRKPGGTYVNKTGIVSNILPSKHILILEDGQTIPLDDIISMTSDIFQFDEF